MSDNKTNQHQRKPSMYQRSHGSRSRYRVPEKRQPISTPAAPKSENILTDELPSNPSLYQADPLHSVASPHYAADAIDPSSTLEYRQKKLRKLQTKNNIKSVLNFGAFIATAVMFAFLIQRFALQSYQVIGSSMSPTLEQEDWLVVSKLGEIIGGDDFIPKRGSVVLFTHPKTGDEKTIIKRVIALPGERVALTENGLVVYNDENPGGFDPDLEYKDRLYLPNPENISSYAPALSDEPLTVPEGHVFVAGDNRSPQSSLDSRNSLGTVPTEKITGTLKARLYPFSDAGVSF